MNSTFDSIIGAPDADRHQLFVETAQRLGTQPAHIEKDFWVCWTLDILFNGRPAGGPRFLFKGGTSLTKAFGVLRRFSEDIDVTVNPADIEHTKTIADLLAMGSNARKRELKAIKSDCGAFIRGPLQQQLLGIIGDAFERNKVASAWSVGEADETIDIDQQSLLFWYPTLFPVTGADSYIQRRVLIESGAKSALDPHVTTSVKPYIADDVSQDLDLTVTDINTSHPARTMWDKLVLAHGQHQWYLAKGEMKGGGHRLTRHYYDLHNLANSTIGNEALSDTDLGEDCVAHGSMFFGRDEFRLDLATPGSFTIMPAPGMLDALRVDYEEMAGMIFGQRPSFDEIMESIRGLEDQLNNGLTPKP